MQVNSNKVIVRKTAEADECRNFDICISGHMCQYDFV